MQTDLAMEPPQLTLDSLLSKPKPVEQKAKSTKIRTSLTLSPNKKRSPIKSKPKFKSKGVGNPVKHLKAPTFQDNSIEEKDELKEESCSIVDTSPKASSILETEEFPEQITKSMHEKPKSKSSRLKSEKPKSNFS